MVRLNDADTAAPTRGLSLGWLSSHCRTSGCSLPLSVSLPPSLPPFLLASLPPSLPPSLPLSLSLSLGWLLPNSVVRRFLEVCDAAPGVVAVHFRAGRTGTMIALWMLAGQHQAGGEGRHLPAEGVPVGRSARQTARLRRASTAAAVESGWLEHPRKGRQGRRATRPPGRPQQNGSGRQRQ